MQIDLRAVDSHIENLKQQHTEMGRMYNCIASMMALSFFQQETMEKIRNNVLRNLEDLQKQRRELQNMIRTLTAAKYYYEQAEQQICDQYMGNARRFRSPAIGWNILQWHRLPSPIRLHLR